MDLGELIYVYKNTIIEDPRSLIGSIIEINNEEQYFKIRLDPDELLNETTDDLTRIVPMDPSGWKKI